MVLLCREVYNLYPYLSNSASVLLTADDAARSSERCLCGCCRCTLGPRPQVRKLFGGLALFGLGCTLLEVRKSIDSFVEISRSGEPHINNYSSRHIEEAI